MNIKKMIVPCEYKAMDDEAGTFEGYGSIFGNIDSYGDVVTKGAFTQTIKERKPVMLWQHYSDEPIGVYIEAKEDDKGLYLKGQLNQDVQKGREAYSLLKQGALQGLSIGYRVKKAERDHDAEVTYLKEIDLFEVSLVTFPANVEATVETVKDLPQSEREFEKFLRDAGFSRNRAKAIIANGFKGMDRDDSDDETIDLVKSIINDLRGF